MSNEKLVVLQGDASKKAEGSWVFTHQGVAADQGFKNVSKHWYAKTQSYEDGLRSIEEGRAVTEDVVCPVSHMTPCVNDNGKFVFRHSSGREFLPTAHAVMQAGNWADTGTWYVQSLLAPKCDHKGREEYARDRGDVETLAAVLRNGLRRLDQNKKFIFRTRQDGSMRAMLTDRYSIVDNRWFLETLRILVPGGRLSHWRGDSDTIYGNILIPDTIREEQDSDYGGMLSIGNSEIGIRRVSSKPSIFRAICMNGCIWGATEGQGIKQVHRGKINLVEFAQEIKDNLFAQIPLLGTGIDALLATHNMKWEGVTAKPVFAQLAKVFSFSKKQATTVLNAYLQEPETTLFGLTNAVTRAGQKFSDAEWVQFDTIGGELVSYDESDFVSLINNAKAMKVKDVESYFANAV